MPLVKREKTLVMKARRDELFWAPWRGVFNLKPQSRAKGVGRLWGYVGLVALALPFGLAACTSAPDSGPQTSAPTGSPGPMTPFRVSDAAWALSSGAGSIQGELEPVSDHARFTCQGKDVVLLPETAWTRQRVQRLYDSTVSADLPVEIVRSKSVPAPADYNQILRHATCDAGGHFSFEALPKGRWYVITVATPLTSPKTQLVVMREVQTRSSPLRLVLNPAVPRP
jgi:hypothetical protein